MRTCYAKFQIWAVLVTCGANACAVGPDYHPPVLELPASFEGASKFEGEATESSEAVQPPPPVVVNVEAGSSAAPDTAALELWWESFHDPKLNSLVERAVASNLDLQLAEARIREARAQLELTEASLFPTLDATTFAERSRTSDNVKRPGNSNSSSTTPKGLTSSLFHAGFDAKWEINFFGAGRAVEAAESSVEASVEAQRNTLLTLLAEVGQSYVSLRGFQHELAFARENVAIQNGTLELQRTRLNAGLASDLTVAQAEAQLFTTQSLVPALETEVMQSYHRLSVLLDLPPTALEEELSDPMPVPTGPATVPPGLPSDLVRRRPDVREAERRLASATAGIGVAIAELFPSFNLTGALGVESGKLSSLAKGGSSIWSPMAGFSLPIFEGGRIQGNIHLQEAHQQEALLVYRQTVQQSLEDVENTLVAYNREQSRRAALERAVDSNRRALDLARKLNEAGVVDFLNVLTAQQSLSESQDQLSQSERTVGTNLIALYKALGGGWQGVEAGTAPIR